MVSEALFDEKVCYDPCFFSFVAFSWAFSRFLALSSPFSLWFQVDFVVNSLLFLWIHSEFIAICSSFLEFFQVFSSLWIFLFLLQLHWFIMVRQHLGLTLILFFTFILVKVPTQWRLRLFSPVPTTSLGADPCNEHLAQKTSLHSLMDLLQNLMMKIWIESLGKDAIIWSILGLSIQFLHKLHKLSSFMCVLLMFGKNSRIDSPKLIEVVFQCCVLLSTISNKVQNLSLITSQRWKLYGKSSNLIDLCLYALAFTNANVKLCIMNVIFAWRIRLYSF